MGFGLDGRRLQDQGLQQQTETKAAGRERRYKPSNLSGPTTFRQSTTTHYLAIAGADSLASRRQPD
jgi:hypothetical protein